MKPIRLNRGVHAVPLLKSQILEAQQNTLSAFEAARYLNVSYKTYVKYAKMYEIFEQHKNQAGIGTRKGPRYVRGHKLEEILEGKHPHYPFKLLKGRLIRAGLLEEECKDCGFRERRVTDYKMPLLLVAVDGNQSNHALQNLKFLCYNCSFLSYGAQYGSASYHVDDDDPDQFIQEHPDSIYSKKSELIETVEGWPDDDEVVVSDYEPNIEVPNDIELTAEEIENLQNEIRGEK